MLLLSYFGEAANFPFMVALLVVSILAAIEGVGLLVGAGIFGFLDSILPDLDLDLEVEGPDLSTPSLTGQLLSWLRIGQVPVIFSLIVFLVAFGLIGLMFQEAVVTVFGTRLPAALASVPAILLSMPVLRLGNRALAYVIPRDETSAISRDRLIGKVATITLGEARKAFPAQAKVKDRFGLTHYVMLEPDVDDVVFLQGERIVLVRRENNIYFGIQSGSDALSD